MKSRDRKNNNNNNNMYYNINITITANNNNDLIGNYDHNDSVRRTVTYYIYSFSHQ